MSDAIIARAGAGTISELMVIGKPVILVPSPNVAEDHQTYNANALVKKEAAILVKDSEIENSLLPEVGNLLIDTQRKESLAKNIKSLAITDAAEKIAKKVLLLADQKIEK